ncbi:Eukaryotic peptide chain release factor GTP-binding subunit [Erysiphe neolycopersici]|uniref:Elongation factor 1-alpha n=1 Tax=Erysiphe neolycopersici TaxID=212602 RepID=A0A420HLJ9_9PEZI|nr:Eukaryotic peptide chain release factor GTP-binding subunit [Erysiphe neolycopersici]
MSDLNSWEDDPAAQDESISRQTQQMHLNIQQKTSAGTFRPDAPSFQPAQNFDQQSVDTYQNYYGKQANQISNNISQYSQQTTLQNRSITKRVTENPTNFSDLNTPITTKDNAPKVLSIGSDSPKPKAKVLSIGLAPTVGKKKVNASSTEPVVTQDPGAKLIVTKATEKSLENGKITTAPPSGRSSPSRGATKSAAQDVDAVQKEIASADVDEETLKDIYGKEHVNIIFIGHVDAGKSTLGGAILIQSGMIDQRTLEKYKKEAKDMARESWWISWVLDLNKEERSQGKTIEVGRAFFETDKRRYSILDAPGHKTYVPSMIGGASQADVGILVISARKGEYETGFEKGGQTREHAMLAKTQGVNKLIVAINKMDDPTVEWSEKRYNECITKLSQFLKATGYNLKNDIHFLPIAAQQMLGLKDRVPEKICPWYKGPSLLEYLDSMAALERKVNAPFMMPINGKYRDMGTIVEGKIEAGAIKKGMSLIMMPNREKVEAAAIYGETEEEVTVGQCGDQVRLRLRGIEEEDILPGFVLCSPKRPVHCVSAFEAQIRVLELKNILSAGFNCVLHVHSAIEEVTFAALLHTLQKGTGRKSKKAPTHAKKGDSIIAMIEVIGGAGTVCVERFEDYQQLGRFTLRDQGQTIAIGKITKLITNEQGDK